MRATDVAKRLAVLVVTAGIIVALAGGGAMVAPSPTPVSPPSTSEYDPTTVNEDPLPAEGDIEPDASVGDGRGLVVIDNGHGNRISRAELEPLVDALVRTGYRVEFYTDGDLADYLDDADAFLVVDPSQEFLEGDVDDVRNFTNDGGRLVMVGEPNRMAISGGLFGTTLRQQESSLTTLASRYGMSIDTQYLYNQDHADANYKYVVAQPTESADLDGVENTTMYTAASVTAHRGTVVLRTAPETRRSGGGEEPDQYPVAVKKGNALLLGDKTFMTADRYNIADNEEFLAYVVEFLIGG